MKASKPAEIRARIIPEIINELAFGDVFLSIRINSF